MATLAVMLTDPQALHRLSDAVQGEHVIRHCTSWESLEAACQDDSVALAILDLFTEGKAHFDVIRRLKMRAERITLVAYVSVSLDRSRDLFDAGRAGLDGLLIAGQDDTPAAFRAVLERAEARGAAQLLRPRLLHLPSTVRDAVMVAVTRAHLRLTSQRLCEILGISKRVLLKTLEDAHCPAPAKLITWGRLIVAAQMLEDGQRTADGVARMLDFPSGSAFRNTTQRYLGATPQEIRDKGGAGWVASRFLLELGSGTPRSAAGGNADDDSDDE